MKTSVTLKGEKLLAEAIRKMGDDITADAEKVIAATALELRTEIVKGYHEGGKVGRIYQKYNPRRTHQASEEGQAPASDTGRLANSVVYTSKKLNAVVKALVEYGAYLEWGTINIAPRPLWVPEANKMRPKYIKRMKALVKRMTK